MIRLYFDEDSMQHAVVEGLRKHGIDVLTALDAGMIEQKDEQQLGFAAKHGRVFYSFNVSDFCRIHADWMARSESHAGIVLARQQHFSVGQQIRRLLKLVSDRSAEQMENRLEFLSTLG